MPRTVRTKVYKFTELSEKAKEKAIEQYRNTHISDEPAWSQENIDSMIKFAEIFPIELTDWSVGGRGEGVSFRFTGDYADEIENLSGQRLATYLWNNYGRKFYKGKYYSLWSKTEKSYKYHKEGFPVLKSRHSKVIFEINSITGYMMDLTLLDPIIKFWKKPDNTTFKELLEECFESWIKAYNADTDYQQSDEYITEEILNNDYEFTQDGKRFN